jgi:hypothetical protein
MRFGIVVGVLLLGSINMAMGEPAGKPVDVTKFDIVGVKLYMSSQEAIVALKSKFGPSLNVGGYWRDMCASSKNVICIQVADGRLHAGGKYADLISFQNDAGRYVFYFVETEDKPDGLYMITYAPAAMQTQADIEQFHQTAIAKYGPPTWPDLSKWGVSQWCGPEIAKPEAGALKCDGSKVPDLTMDYKELKLQDSSYMLRMRGLVEKLTTQKKPVL